MPRKAKITDKELQEIKEQNKRKLDELLNNPKIVEDMAKKQYGDSWKIIYAYERHPNNGSVEQQYLMNSLKKSEERKKEFMELLKRVKVKLKE